MAEKRSAAGQRWDEMIAWRHARNSDLTPDDAHDRCQTCGSDDPAICVGGGEKPHPHVISKVYPKAFYNCCPDPFHDQTGGRDAD